MNIEIGPGDLKAVVENKGGIGGANVGPHGSTAPWSRLQMIGLSTTDEKLRPYSSDVTLIVGQGALRDRNISKYNKLIFSEEIMPAINNFVPDCSDNFHLVLYYRDSLLFRAEIVYK
jgi:hypothetical protein